MTERPIVMRDAEVRAIFAGAKTQTRRVVEPMRGRQAQWLSIEGIARSPKLDLARLRDDAGPRWAGRLGAQMDHPGGGPLGWVASPWDIGDRLWVRECWGIFDRHSFGTPYGIAWRATHPAPEDGVVWIDGPEEWSGEKWLATDRWRSAASMPRWASRLTLEVTSVRVERVQSISEDDARAEGVAYDLPADAERRGSFARRWDATEGKRAGRLWRDDPWVWCVGFKVAP